MYNPEIIFSEKEEVTVIPGVIANKVEPFLQEKKLHTKQFLSQNLKMVGRVAAYIVEERELIMLLLLLQK